MPSLGFKDTRSVWASDAHTGPPAGEACGSRTAALPRLRAGGWITWPSLDRILAQGAVVRRRNRARRRGVSRLVFVGLLADAVERGQKIIDNREVRNDAKGTDCRDVHGNWLPGHQFVRPQIWAAPSGMSTPNRHPY